MGSAEQPEKKYKPNDCSTRWHQCEANNYTFATLRYLANEGDVEKYSTFGRVPHSLSDISDDGQDYSAIDIDTPFLTTKQEATNDMNAEQKGFLKPFIGP